MGEKILARTAAAGPLQTLSPAELELATMPVTIDPNPEQVKAWVRFGDAPVLVDALAERWTPRAVGIRLTVGEKELRTWVWASAVERVRPPSPAPR